MPPIGSEVRIPGRDAILVTESFSIDLFVEPFRETLLEVLAETTGIVNTHSTDVNVDAEGPFEGVGNTTTPSTTPDDDNRRRRMSRVDTDMMSNRRAYSSSEGGYRRLLLTNNDDNDDNVTNSTITPPRDPRSCVANFTTLDASLQNEFNSEQLVAIGAALSAAIASWEPPPCGEQVLELEEFIRLPMPPPSPPSFPPPMLTNPSEFDLLFWIFAGTMLFLLSALLCWASYAYLSKRFNLVFVFQGQKENGRAEEGFSTGLEMVNTNTHGRNGGTSTKPSIFPTSHRHRTAPEQLHIVSGVASDTHPPHAAHTSHTAHTAHVAQTSAASLPLPVLQEEFGPRMTNDQRIFYA